MEVEKDKLVMDLVLSIISINNWTLEQSYKIKDRLRSEQIFKISILSKKSEGEIIVAITKAGYKKSDYVKSLVAKRLKCLAIYFSTDKLDLLIEAIKNNDVKKIDELLLCVNGIGPTVLNHFKVLSGIT